MAGRSCCVMIEHDGAGRWWGAGGTNGGWPVWSEEECEEGV